MVAMKLLTIFLLLSTSLALAETHDELIDRAFEAVDDDLSARWSYTRTEDADDEVYVGRYDPRLPELEQWTLISVDGREPTADETEDYLEKRNRDLERKSDGDDDELKSMVKEGSAVLVSETDEYWLFDFEPMGDSEDDEVFMESVDGTLKIMKNGHYVAEISLQNSGTIKPGKGVKIKEFFTQLQFAPIAEGGKALPQRVQASIKGKAFMVVKIDQTQTVTFTEFEQAFD